ncbi:MAG: hypothetical protein Q9201_005398 [Fulgogasparrea decipioides]
MALIPFIFNEKALIPFVSSRKALIPFPWFNARFQRAIANMEFKALNAKIKELQHRQTTADKSIEGLEQGLGTAKKEIGELQHAQRLVHVRDMLKNGLKQASVCSKENIIFGHSPSKGWKQKATGWDEMRRLSNMEAHRMSLKDAHICISGNFSKIIETFRLDAETDIQRAIINAYTVSDVQKFITLVSPTELRNMSAAEMGVWALKSSRVEKIGAFGRKHLALDPQADASILYLYYALRRNVDIMPGAQRVQALEDWVRLCKGLRRILLKERGQEERKRQAAKTGHDPKKTEASRNGQDYQTVMMARRHLKPRIQRRSFASWANYEPSSTTQRPQPPGRYRQNTILALSPKLLQSSTAREYLPQSQATHNVFGYWQPKSIYLGRRLWVSLRWAFKL